MASKSDENQLGSSYDWYYQIENRDHFDRDYVLSVSACKTSSDSDPLIKRIPANGTSVALIKDPNQTILNTMRWLERALGPAGRSISDRLRREGQRLLGFDPVNSSLSKNFISTTRWVSPSLV